MERRLWANILLLADRGRSHGGRRGADILGAGTAPVERVRKQCVLGGLESVLDRKAQVNLKRQLLDGVAQAKLACSEPSAGHSRWSH